MLLHAPTPLALNDLVHRFFRENEVYRIDHYLGKDTVQNLLAFRFGADFFLLLVFVAIPKVRRPANLGCSELGQMNRRDHAACTTASELDRRQRERHQARVSLKGRALITR